VTRPSAAGGVAAVATTNDRVTAAVSNAVGNTKNN
jgi:hypothetical protein